MDHVKSFEIGGTTYNVARATAVQQDEVLSMLAQPLVEKLAIAEKGEMVDEEFVFNFFCVMPYTAKQKIDELLLNKVTRSGENVSLTARDFSAFDLQQIRAKVLIWNLEPFFVYWAGVIKKAKDQSKEAESKAQ